MTAPSLTPSASPSRPQAPGGGPGEPDAAALFSRRLALRRARDPGADGRFWCSVVTTGVYCRPSCPSRHARPDHIRFHDSLEAARRTGFRPCRRCRPEEPGLAERRRLLVERACAAFRTSPRALTAQDVARSLNVSPSHLHRLFREVLGTTPGAYAASSTSVRPLRPNGV